MAFAINERLIQRITNLIAEANSVPVEKQGFVGLRGPNVFPRQLNTLRSDRKTCRAGFSPCEPPRRLDLLLAISNQSDFPEERLARWGLACWALGAPGTAGSFDTALIAMAPEVFLAIRGEEHP